MTDDSIFSRIDDLVKTEHELRAKLRPFGPTKDGAK